MKNVLIFGAGKFGTEKYHRLIKEYDVNVIAYIDNDSKNGICYVMESQLFLLKKYVI